MKSFRPRLAVIISLHGYKGCIVFNEVKDNRRYLGATGNIIRDCAPNTQGYLHANNSKVINRVLREEITYINGTYVQGVPNNPDSTVYDNRIDDIAYNLKNFPLNQSNDIANDGSYWTIQSLMESGKIFEVLSVELESGTWNPVSDSGTCCTINVNDFVTVSSDLSTISCDNLFM